VLARADNLPTGMEQQIVIDIRGQVVAPKQRAQIIRGILEKTGGVISESAIGFKND
jgi:hypothetical protein